MDQIETIIQRARIIEEATARVCSWCLPIYHGVKQLCEKNYDLLTEQANCENCDQTVVTFLHKYCNPCATELRICSKCGSSRPNDNRTEFELEFAEELSKYVEKLTIEGQEEDNSEEENPEIADEKYFEVDEEYNFEIAEEYNFEIDEDNYFGTNEQNNFELDEESSSEIIEEFDFGLDRGSDRSISDLESDSESSSSSSNQAGGIERAELPISESSTTSIEPCPPIQ